jgi:hypothetical protein
MTEREKRLLEVIAEDVIEEIKRREVWVHQVCW